MSVAIAANRALHEQLVNEVANGIARLQNSHGDAKPAASP
jgi:hypothetical protein